VLRTEKEHGRPRAFELGHTFCHALECPATGYSRPVCLHGEGPMADRVVAMAFELSHDWGFVRKQIAQRVARPTLRTMGMKTRPAAIIDGDFAQCRFSGGFDGAGQKVIDGKLTLLRSLSRGIGDASRNKRMVRRNAVSPAFV